MREKKTLSTIDAELDLRWFFSDAPTECGVRSAIGAQLDRLEAYSCTHGGENGLTWTGRMAVRKGKTAARPCDADMPEERLDAARRANAIAARLRRLTRRQQYVLELQYGAKAALSGGVSLALACEQPAAMRGYDEAKRRVLIARGGGTPCRATGQDTATKRLWLCWLATRSAGAGPELYAAIVGSAMRELGLAVEAYLTVRGSER
jgi:hypothetical protein